MFKANVEKIISSGEDRPDLFSHHVLNADGTVTASIFGRPINHHDGEKFTACDTTIIPEKNWEFEYVVKKNNFRAYFNDSSDIDNNTLASFEIINSEGKARWINYKLFGATPTGTEVNGNKIKWLNVFEDIDLEYVVDTWRLKENIILKNIEAAQKLDYTFTLKMDSGVRLEQKPDGTILFVDTETQETLWRIATPYAYDSGEGDNKKTIRNVRYEITAVISEDIEYQAIKVVLDDSCFVQNAVFPVVIDPTTDTFTVAASGDDGYIWDARSAWSFPYNPAVSDNSEWLAAAKYYSSYQYRVFVSLFRFDTSSIPDTATLNSAKLKLYLTTFNLSGVNTIKADYYSFTTITTGDFTANNPSGSAFSTSSGTINQYNDYTLSNISNISLTGYTGFRIGSTGNDSTGVNENFWFYSYDHGSNRPQLEVAYTAGFSKKIFGSTPVKVMGVTAQKVNGVS